MMQVEISSLLRPSGNKYISRVCCKKSLKNTFGGEKLVDWVLFFTPAQDTLENSLELCRQWCIKRNHEFTIDHVVERMPEPSICSAGVLTMRGRCNNRREAKRKPLESVEVEIV